MCETCCKALLKLELFNSSILQAVLTLELFQSQEIAKLSMLSSSYALFLLVTLGITESPFLSWQMIFCGFLWLYLSQMCQHPLEKDRWKVPPHASWQIQTQSVLSWSNRVGSALVPCSQSQALPRPPCREVSTLRCAQKHREELMRLRRHKVCGKRQMGGVFWPQSCLAMVKLAPAMGTTSSRNASGNWRCWFSRENKNKACYHSTELRRESKRDNK